MLEASFLDIIGWVLFGCGILLMYYYWMLLLYYITIVVFMVIPLFIAYQTDASKTGWLIAIVVEATLMIAIVVGVRKVNREAADYERNRQLEETSQQRCSPYSSPMTSVVKVITEVPEVTEVPEEDYSEASNVEYSPRDILSNNDDIDYIRSQLSDAENAYLEECAKYQSLTLDRMIANGFENPMSGMPISKLEQMEIKYRIEVLMNESEERLRQHDLYDDNTHIHWLMDTIFSIRGE